MWDIRVIKGGNKKNPNVITELADKQSVETDVDRKDYLLVTVFWFLFLFFSWLH